MEGGRHGVARGHWPMRTLSGGHETNEASNFGVGSLIVGGDAPGSVSRTRSVTRDESLIV